MKKTGLALVVLALSLMVIGTGYANLTDNNSTVPVAGTDYLRIGVRNCQVLDQGPDPQCLPGGNPEGKDVAATTAEDSGAPVFQINGRNYYSVISQSVSNAYPSYETGCVMEIANGGKVPCQIDSAVLSWTGSTDMKDYISLHAFEIYQGEKSIASGSTWADLRQTLQGFKLAPGQVITTKLSYYFKGVNSAGTPMPQNATGKVQIALQTSQGEGGGSGGGGGSTPGEGGGDNDTPGSPDSGGGEPGPIPEEIIVPAPPQVQAPSPAPDLGQTGAQPVPVKPVSPEPIMVRGKPITRLPYTGGNPLPYILGGIVIVGAGVLFWRKS